MSAVAYLYIPTPEAAQVASMLQHVDASICVSHFGLKDPPKPWSGTVRAMATALMAQGELNKSAFLRDHASKVGLDITLNYDPRWLHSTIALSGPSAPVVEDLAVRLSNLLSPYLCVQGSLGAGKSQAWQVLYERTDCPAEIRESLRAA
jgi:hypothetical protein